MENGKTKKKSRNRLLIAVALFVLFIMRTQIGNSIGSLLHYGGCPNCGDSWYWKSNGSIVVESTRALKKGEDYTGEDIIYAEITKGIMICKKCLAKPAELDEERIEKNLLSNPEGGWTLEKAAQVKEAVIRYKKEKLKNNSGNE